MRCWGSHVTLGGGGSHWVSLGPGKYRVVGKNRSIVRLCWQNWEWVESEWDREIRKARKSRKFAQTFTHRNVNEQDEGFALAVFQAYILE